MVAIKQFKEPDEDDQVRQTSSSQLPVHAYEQNAVSVVEPHTSSCIMGTGRPCLLFQGALILVKPQGAAPPAACAPFCLHHARPLLEQDSQ